jgi:hypothetical protein
MEKPSDIQRSQQTGTRLNSVRLLAVCVIAGGRLVVIFGMVRPLADELFHGAFGAAAPRALFF